jgi:hypothetical protein
VNDETNQRADLPTHDEIRQRRRNAALELMEARDQLRLAVELGINNQQHADRVTAAEATWDNLVRFRPDTRGRTA